MVFLKTLVHLIQELKCSVFKAEFDIEIVQLKFQAH